MSVAVFRDGSAKAKVFGTAGVEYEESQEVLQFIHCEAKKQLVLRMNRDTQFSIQCDAHSSVHCTTHTVQYTVRRTQFSTLYDAHSSVHCTTHTVQYTVRRTQFSTLYDAHSSIHCTTHTVQYTVRRT